MKNRERAARAQSRPFKAELAELSDKRGKELAAHFRSGEAPPFTEELFNRRETCRLCESGDVERVVKLKPIPLAEKYTLFPDEARNAPRYPIDLYMCRTCSHVQLLDVIDSENLWDEYTYRSGQTQGIIDHLKEASEEIIAKYAPPSGSLVIDVGSNDGTLLRFFKNAGYRVHGIDPAKEIAKKATLSGIETTPSVLTRGVAEEIRNAFGPSSVVTAFNVFAHADDLGEMADAICSLLAPNGIFVFEVQYLLDIVEKCLLGTLFHEHMSHHSLHPLIRFLDLHGLELIHVKRVSIQKGSLIGTAQKKNGPRHVDRSVADLLHLERERHLEEIDSMLDFERGLERNRTKAKEWTTSWKRQGLRVAGYGAARSGPTLMIQFGFDDCVQTIFDDHPQKVGRYSPPTGIPVIPTAELMKKKPDVVIILAWIHARSIMEKHLEYLETGGKFVLCTPELRMISKQDLA